MNVINTTIYGFNRQVNMKRLLAKNYILQILDQYQNYLLDLKQYVVQMERFLTVMFFCLVAVITYLTHFIFFTKLSIPMTILAILFYLGHFITFYYIIYSSSKISTFNKHFTHWYFSQIQHCQSNQLDIFNHRHYFKVSS